MKQRDPKFELIEACSIGADGGFFTGYAVQIWTWDALHEEWRSGYIPVNEKGIRSVWCTVEEAKAGARAYLEKKLSESQN